MTPLFPQIPSHDRPVDSARIPLEPSAFEEFVAVGRSAQCTSIDAIQALSPVDVRQMDTAEQRLAQFRAMFDREPLHGLFAGIMPRSGEWCPRQSVDFMTVGEWLADEGRRVMASRGELLRINPFTGVNEHGGLGWHRLVTSRTVASFSHILLECAQTSLADQCAFWYGAITLHHMPVIALVDTGNGVIQGVIRVDCTSLSEFDHASALLQQTFASSQNPAMRLDTYSLSLPVASVRLSGCTRSDTGTFQKLLYLRQRQHETF